MRIMMNKKVKNKSVKELFKDFIKHCEVKNLSSSTLKYYNECWTEFRKFYTGEDINEATINEYILYLRSNPNLNNVSINTRLRGLRTIIYYFIKLGYLDSFKIILPKAEKQLKETYTEQEMKLLLEKPDINKCEFTEYRNWVIVNYLLSTGNRAKTVVNIKIKDLDFNEGYIKIKYTKNKKQQIIPLSRILSSILQEYLSYRNGESEDYLFCNSYGEQLTVNALGHAIRKYNRRRGVNKTSLHLFRHTFAKHWIMNGGDIFRLQKILGHSSMDIVKEYISIFGEDLMKDFDKYNILESFAYQRKKIKL